MLELVFVIMIVGFLIIAVILPGVINANAQKKLVSCGGNLKALSEALALYAREHYAMVPLTTSLQSDLVPDFISRIPKCSGSGNDYNYESDSSHMIYTFICKGMNHEKAKAPADYPRFTSGAGLDLGNAMHK